MHLVEIKDVNALIDNKLYFEQRTKNEQQILKKIVEMSRNNDYETGNLLHYLSRQHYYTLIGKDLSRQTSTTISQEINFTEKLDHLSWCSNDFHGWEAACKRKIQTIEQPRNIECIEWIKLL